MKNKLIKGNNDNKCVFACVCVRCMQSVSPLLVPGSSHAAFPVFQLRQSALAPSFSSKLISFRQIAKVASPLFNLHACQCLRMFIFISFMCLFRRVCFEIRRDLEKEGEDAGRGVVAGRMGGCVMVTNTCDKRHGTPVPLCK